MFKLIQPSWRMRLQQQLTWSLSKGLDLVLDGLPHHGVHVYIHVHSSLLGEVVEHVGGPHSLGSSLFISKDEINPLMQLTTDEL